MSDIEKLTAYNSIKAYLGLEDRKELARKLNIESPNLESRIAGLTQEDEFALLLYFSESCKHILGFDEGFSFLTNSYSADLYVEHINGKRMLIEVKSVGEGNAFKISSGNLDKRIDFAKNFGVELYFAVKVLGSWGLYKSEQIKSKNGKITHPIDLNESCLEQMFNYETFIATKGFKAISKYSSVGPGISEIKHLEYGFLMAYSFEYEGKVLFDGSSVDSSVLIEYFHDIMSMQSQDVNRISENEVEIVEELVTNATIPVYALLMSPLRHVVNKFGILHDSTTFFKSILEDRGHILPKNAVIELLLDLSKKTNHIGIVRPTSITYKSDNSFEAEIASC